MSRFFRTSTTWVVDFRYDGHPRRWYKAAAPGVDMPRQMSEELHALHGRRAQLVSVRPATADEEARYLRGEEPRHSLCPTGRHGPVGPDLT